MKKSKFALLVFTGLFAAACLIAATSFANNIGGRCTFQGLSNGTWNYSVTNSFGHVVDSGSGVSSAYASDVYNIYGCGDNGGGNSVET